MEDREKYQLKKCPHCGEVWNLHMLKNWLTGLYWVACAACNSTGPRHDDKSFAASYWNNRVR